MELADLGGRGPSRGIVVSRHVVDALRSNAGLRLVTGFLTIFMAFTLREPPASLGWTGNATVLMGLVIGAAGAGNTLGVFAVMYSLYEGLGDNVSFGCLLCKECAFRHVSIKSKVRFATLDRYLHYYYCTILFLIAILFVIYGWYNFKSTMKPHTYTYFFSPKYNDRLRRMKC